MARTEQQWLKHLIQCHDREKPELTLLDSYYEGEQPLSYLAPELQAEMDERIRQVVVNWPLLVADSLEERLDVEGFRFPDEAQADEELWRIWQANRLDSRSHQGHLDGLVMRRAYVIVGAREDDPKTPLITVESPLDVYAEHDPRTGAVAAAVKRWCEEEEGASPIEHATLYLPGATSWWTKDRSGVWAEDTGDEGEPTRDDHGLGEVPVVPLANRARLKKPGGVSELKAVIPLSDAACKIATDMMVSAEYHATPRRVAFGFGEDDFQDEQGRKVSAFSRIIGRVWATERRRGSGEDGGADVIQFPEAQLKNFHDTINQLAQLVASLAGLPPHFLGYTSQNPASADAIRSSESRLVKRAERRQREWGEAWEQVMRLALRIRDGEWDPRVMSLETVWRDASTPTVAQAADAAVKKYSAKIVPLRQTREDLGYSQAQIARMEEQDREAAEDAMARVLAGDLAALQAGPKPGVDDEDEPLPEPADAA
ncbi:putative phage protein [Streptomyces scabiei 87.22]|uniref:Putative phage protein n=1 Tax=Streptomyces scabiei (strain 87.22) TaxID=680198 RepID=C9Z940_STRSW|nr:MULTISPECIES: phage portal protein [Streptomyces]MBP5875666.1 phage portal protein [Streptomyces sp. LBUM 1477]MDX2652121.1 phage portal protein [Streptomyces scabiei]MDX2725853.1 phage portal protein [Streptomyces scabiei]MDX2749643.1 phage portal protein [Streptomyces scabiei]MDX2863972.1 phage portal protein [Streptomyces scabiei]